MIFNRATSLGVQNKDSVTVLQTDLTGIQFSGPHRSKFIIIIIIIIIIAVVTSILDSLQIREILLLDLELSSNGIIGARRQRNSHAAQAAMD